MSEIENRLASNLGDVLANGPGLRIRERQGGGSWVAAKDTVNGYVYLSGLGGMGVGSMWFPTVSGSLNYSADPTYDDAPDVLTSEEGGIYGLALGGRVIVNAEDARLANERTAAGMMTRSLHVIDVDPIERPT